VDATLKRLARNIRARARELDIPLTHVADRAGVGRANFWTVLKGTSSPTLKWIVKVADTLECDAAKLLSSSPLSQAGAPPRRRQR
jgi:DNA-binding phage protein